MSDRHSSTTHDPSSGARVGADRKLPFELGPYRAVEKLGEGGMGVIFLADQLEPVERRVALKLLRWGPTSDSDRRRFEQERRLLARLSHPNIAQLYDAGTAPDGTPFVAMEWIQGRDIDDFCDHRRLTIEERVRLIVSVCRAVQAAHQNRLIHRDLKPANVVVAEIDGDHVAKLIDFGIAKPLPELGTQGEPLTQFDVVVGTPSYMSPEALGVEGADGAAWELDTRTDVYSLGILLFELLVGETPFADASSHGLEVARSLSHEPTFYPSRHWKKMPSRERDTRAQARGTRAATLSRRLGGDLDWIIAKACAFSREERYASANALAEDLERWLDSRTVSVGPPTLRYQLRKLFARRRGLVLGTVGVAASLLLGVVGTSAGLVRAREAERLARLEAEAAREAEAEAEQVASFLNGLFMAANPQNEGRSDVTAIEVLERGADTISDRFLDQPMLRSRLLTNMASTFYSLRQLDRARGLIEEALAVRSKAVAPEDPALLHLLEVHGSVLRALGDLDGASISLQRALEITRSQPSPDPRRQARAIGSLALLHLVRGETDLAHSLLREAIGIGRAHEIPELAQWLANLGASLVDSPGQDAEAEALIREAIEIWQGAQGNELMIAAAHLNLGRLAHNVRQEFDLAEMEYQRALQLRRQVHGDAHVDLGHSWLALTSLYLDEKRFEEALQSGERALQIYEQALGREHYLCARALHLLGRVLSAQGRQGPARDLIEEALATRITTFPEGHYEIEESRLALEEIAARH